MHGIKIKKNRVRTFHWLYLNELFEMYSFFFLVFLDRVKYVFEENFALLVLNRRYVNAITFNIK